MNVWLDRRTNAYAHLKMAFMQFGIEYQEINCPHRENVVQIVAEETEEVDQATFQLILIQSENSDLGPPNGKR